ncbi:MAG: hypothetical protein KF778_21270 [Rhodocyclaceae bacterium]|nr:hypothetical protein [Rhodocyclaceae bacterium]
MKLIQLFAAVSITLSAAAFAADDHNHAHEHKGLQGGVVAEANHLDFELVAKPDTIKLYIRDHDKPLGVKDATAKVTLLSGASKTEVDLAPSGEALEAKGTFSIAAGAKAVAVVNLPSKKVATVRFVIQ